MSFHKNKIKNSKKFAQKINCFIFGAIKMCNNRMGGWEGLRGSLLKDRFIVSLKFF